MIDSHLCTLAATSRKVLKPMKILLLDLGKKTAAIFSEYHWEMKKHMKKRM